MKLFLLVLGFSILVQTIKAQALGKAADADTLEASQLGEVVIRAYGGRQGLMAIPASVGLVTASEIRNRSQEVLPGLLNNVPGVFAHQGALNTNRITIRGIGARVPYATGRIRSAIDEIPLTNGSGYSMAEYVDPSFADHIEIAKSPSTPVHGASLGGIIHLSTLPDELPQFATGYRLGLGSFGYQLHQAMVEHQQSDKAAGRLLLSLGSADGWRENNSHNRRFGGYSGRFKTGSGTTVQALLFVQQMKAYIPSSIDSATFESNPQAAAASWKKTKGYENGSRAIGGISLRQQLTGNLHLKATIYGHRVLEEELRPFDHFNETRLLGGARLQAEQILQLAGQKLLISAGVETMAENVGFGNVANADGQGSLGDSISRNTERIRVLAFFGHAELPVPKGVVSAGFYAQKLDNHFINRSIRQNRTVDGTYRTGYTVSPRLAINRQIGRHANAYASLSHGFAPPSLQETLDSQGLLNPGIKPETSYTYDLGMRLHSGQGRMFADMALFYMDIRNLLVAERVDADRWVGRNAGKAIHRGFEMLLSYSTAGLPWPAITLLNAKAALAAGDYRFADFNDRGVDQSGHQVPGIPNLTANLSGELRHKTGILLNARAEFVGKMAMNDSNTKTYGPYGLLHVGSSYSQTFKSLHITLGGQVINATNARYASMILVNAPGQRNQRWYYPGMPRHFQLSLMFRFTG